MHSLLHRALARISIGSLTVRDIDGKEYVFGTKGQTPSGTLTVKNPGFYKRVMREGSLGFGESYMDGWWEADNLVNVVGVILLNDIGGDLPQSLKVAAHILKDAHRRVKGTAKKNIQAHYDIGNDFYELFLDANMGYTCAYQIKPTDTIEDMQNQKHELVSRKLQLKPGERIVDLGCGFGGMLRYAAKHYGITGVGYTLSEGQVEWGNRKIKEEGLQDKIRLELKDYRDATGEYDKVVSIGMAEHAWDNKRGYSVLMEKAASMIPMGGIGLVHTIGSIDKMDAPSDPWITKYIFPGGRIPRLPELMIAANAAGLTVGHIENLKPHYAETLRHWDEKFWKNESKIRALGSQYDDHFMRMWDFYLQGCDAGFRYGSLQLYQLLFCKGKQWTLPMHMEFGLPETK
ncbi:MAG TPA: class I SAM-dependent methyltransferase [Candidatus Peribacteraceae bacterium]|nr:class I SAM-dependent methyltransferase [Candidatus Peribacteraceae bacterium]